MAWPADTNRSHPYLVTLAVLMAALLWQGCAMTPALPVTDAAESLPDTYDTVLFQSDEASEEAAMESPAMPTAEPITLWWQEWGDARLDLIVDSVLVANADIRMAAARVLEVQEAFRISRSARLPMVQATADGSRQNTPTNIGATGRFSESIPGFPDRFDVTQYSASLGLAWELDFWGKARASSKAAFSQFVATAAEYEAARIGVVSETISDYFELLDVREQIRLADEQLSLLDERLEVTSDRYRRGLVSSFEWYGLQQQTDEAKAARPMLDVQYVTARGRLAVLLGGSAETVESLIDMEGAPLASGAHFPDVLPSELVRGRPDVAAAAARLETARQMVGVRRAEQFPSFSLTAAGGTQSSDLVNLLETSTQRFWLFGGSLTAPVFASGARRAAVRQAWAQYEQAAAAYEKAVLSAFQDVSGALAGFTAEDQRLQAVVSAHQAARASHVTARDRYLRGVGNYTALVDARLNELRTRTALSSAIRSAALARLNVYRAIGGNWLPESDSHSD